jgi:hypothetical protein
MNRQNFITITLIITGLAFNPAMGEGVEQKVSQNLTLNRSITSSIADVLQKRGIDEDAAVEMADQSIDEKDERSLAIMMQYLESQNIVTKEEVLAYLGQSALHKQKLNVKSYDHLLGMVAKIKEKPVDENTRTQLSQIAKYNGYLS